MEIVNKMVNEFLDVREKCKNCRRIFSSLSHCIHTEIALQCNYCRKYLCSTCGGVDGYILSCDTCADCCRACDPDLHGYDDEDAYDDEDEDFDYSDYYYGGISNDAEEVTEYSSNFDYDDYCDRYYEEQGRY